MSLVEQLHIERKARLARLGSVPFKQPPMRSIPATTVRAIVPIAKPVETSSDAGYEIAWHEVICGSPLFEHASWQVFRIADIQKIVGAYYGISLLDMVSQRRTLNLVRPRQVAMYLSKVLTLRSLPEIGRRFGGRDHTTVLHAVRKVAQQMAKTPEIAAEVQALSVLIQGAAHEATHS